MNDVKATTVNVDVSEAVKGLKLLQRETRKTIQALREVDGSVSVGVDDEYGAYLGNLSYLVGDLGAVERYINRQLYDATRSTKFHHITIHYKRGDGATTSALALLQKFNLLTMVTTNLPHHYDSGISDRILQLDKPIRGDYKIRTSGVIILDNRITHGQFIDKYGDIKPNQRTITLYGHED
jgi:hypothetical protein